MANADRIAAAFITEIKMGLLSRGHWWFRFLPRRIQAWIAGRVND